MEAARLYQASASVRPGLGLPAASRVKIAASRVYLMIKVQIAT